MRCDYYTYYKIYIQYNNGDTVEIEEIDKDTSQRHYFYEVKERDPDFEELTYTILQEYVKNINIKQRINYNAILKKDIFKDNTWLYIESAKEKYIEICKENDILESDVIAIWKEDEYHYRYIKILMNYFIVKLYIPNYIIFLFFFES